MSIFFQVLFLGLALPAKTKETFQLDQWSPPVIYAGRPLIYKNTLFVPDRFDEKIKVYDVTEGFERPIGLWQTPGPGLGPGEIPKGSRINNVTVNPSNGTLWISHRLGFTVYNQYGRFLKTIKRSGNSSWLVVKENTICMTSPNPLRDRKILTLVKIGEKPPLWQIDYPSGIPVNEEGAYINERMEMYHFDGTYYCYNPTIGEMIAADDSGNISFMTRIAQNLSSEVQIEDRIERFVPGIPFTLTSLPNPYSGISVSDGRLMLLGMQRCIGIITADGSRFDIPPGNEKVLKTMVEIDVKTGKVLGEYFHEVGVHWIYLLGVHRGKLTFINSETGDRIYQINHSSLKRIKRLIF